MITVKWIVTNVIGPVWSEEIEEISNGLESISATFYDLRKSIHTITIRISSPINRISLPWISFLSVMQSLRLSASLPLIFTHHFTMVTFGSSHWTRSCVGLSPIGFFYPCVSLVSEMTDLSELVIRWFKVKLTWVTCSKHVVPSGSWLVTSQDQ